MSYINNMNPRRMIWFNQNAPKNKIDLWLSYNKHYEDTSEDETTDAQETTDNPSQRNCDLILKAWDCGKWIPIVGFNTTAANKIDIVEGNTLYHPAIFTGENPNDLYDAGTLGELLANTNFVTESEWQNLFDTTQFQNAFNSLIIGGNDYNWSTLINNNIDFATTTRCGGILSDTHTYDALSAFKPIEVKFYPTTSAYSSKLHRLCVSASDVIEQINGYYNDNPGGSSININWNSTTIHQLAEVLQDIFKNSSSLGFEDVWSLASDPHVYPHIWGVSETNAGKFLRINPVWNPEGSGWSQSNNNMDWVDLGDIVPEYTAGVGINIPTGTTVINVNILEKEASPHLSGETLIRIVDNPSGQVFVHNITSNGMGITTLNSYEYTEVETDASKFVIALKNKNTNPIYIKLNHQSPMSVEASGGTIEYVLTDWDFVASGIPSGNTLITVQFGAVKIEPIKTLS